MIGNSEKNFVINEGYNHDNYYGKLDTGALMNVIETGSQDVALGFGFIGLVAATSAFF